VILPQRDVALVAIPADPAMHSLPGYPESFGDLGHRHPGLDFEHGRYRCSVMVNSTSTRRSVTQVLIPMCHAGPETGQRCAYAVPTYAVPTLSGLT
jgi:hypothetical protein